MAFAETPTGQASAAQTVTVTDRTTALVLAALANVAYSPGVADSVLAPALVTFTRYTAAMGFQPMREWQYLHDSTFSISDPDDSLAGALIDHPERDPFLGSCPGDERLEPLRNSLLRNGLAVPNGRNF